MPAQRYCSKCRKTMADTNFYTYKDGTKCELCKTCLTMHVNNWEPETFTWLLEKFDVPYIPAEWNVLRDRAYAKDPYKMNGMSVFGKYLSKMKLKQFKNFHWVDTEKLQAEAEEKAKMLGKPADIAKQELEEMKQAYENGEISEAQYQTYAETHAPDPSFNNPELAAPPNAKNEVNHMGFQYPENGQFEEVELIDVGADLTAEDKVYLAMKWGRLYRADEWVALEKLYKDFMSSFDIQDAARQDTLKKICKTSLKMDQAIDAGDIDTYQKLSRVYDSMMKSAKFTQAQNDEEAANHFDAVGAIVAFCEREGGYIPDIKIEEDKDIIDTIIRDNREYLSTLINNDSSLSQQIEQYLKKEAILNQQKRDKKEARERGLEAVEVTDTDFKEFYDSINEDIAADKDFIKSELENVEEEKE